MSDSTDRAPPAFDWEAWYAGGGGRRPADPEVTRPLRGIYEEQWPLFDGELAVERVELGTPDLAAARDGLVPESRVRARRRVGLVR